MELELFQTSWENLFEVIRNSKINSSGNFWASIQHLEEQHLTKTRTLDDSPHENISVTQMTSDISLDKSSEVSSVSSGCNKDSVDSTLADRIEQLRDELIIHAKIPKIKVDGAIRMIKFMNREFINKIKELIWDELPATDSMDEDEVEEFNKKIDKLAGDLK